MSDPVKAHEEWVGRQFAADRASSLSFSFGESGPREVRRVIAAKSEFRGGEGCVYKSDGRNVKVYDSKGTHILHIDHADIVDVMRVLSHASGLAVAT